MVYGASGGGLGGSGGGRVGSVASKWNQMHQQNNQNQFQGRQALAQKSKMNSSGSKFQGVGARINQWSNQGNQGNFRGGNSNFGGQKNYNQQNFQNEEESSEESSSDDSDDTSFTSSESQHQNSQLTQGDFGGRFGGGQMKFGSQNKNFGNQNFAQKSKFGGQFGGHKLLNNQSQPNEPSEDNNPHIHNNAGQGSRVNVKNMVKSANQAQERTDKAWMNPSKFNNNQSYSKREMQEQAAGIRPNYKGGLVKNMVANRNNNNWQPNNTDTRSRKESKERDPLACNMKSTINKWKQADESTAPTAGIPESLLE